MPFCKSNLLNKYYNDFTILIQSQGHGLFVFIKLKVISLDFEYIFCVLDFRIGGKDT